MPAKKGKLATLKVSELFTIHSGDFHATNELDPGDVPLISCGDTNNGLVDYFDIPPAKTYQRAITIAYNGQPLTAKFHPYKFGAKDDVAVLVPLQPMEDASLLYIAALLNSNRWRYSYGRKCFKQKLTEFTLTVPVIERDGETLLDEQSIAALFPQSYLDFLPEKKNAGVKKVPSLKWKVFNIREVLDLERGDFHSIAALDPGEHMTVSRVTEDNGVVGYFERPEEAQVYPRGLITVSTVGADAFVQLDKFIATDNVIICTPKKPMRATTIFFIAFTINYQKWRYSYGRQCYQEKLGKVNIYLPIKANGEIDEDTIERIVKQASYWPQIEKRFDSVLTFAPKTAGAPFLPGM